MFLAVDIFANLGFERFCYFWVEFVFEVETVGFLNISICTDRLCNYIRAIMPDKAQEFLVFCSAQTLCHSSVQRGRLFLPTKFSNVEMRDLLRHRDGTVAVT